MAATAPVVDPLAEPASGDGFWESLPDVSGAPVLGRSSDGAATQRADVANQLLASARSHSVHRKQEEDSWGTHKIVSGILMMVGAVLWFFFGLLAGRLFFYPPVLFVAGVIALINGISQKMSR